MKIVDVTKYSSRIPLTIVYRGKEESLFDKDKIINQIIVESVDDILPFITTDIKYSFRGQSSSEWSLKSSIERFFNDRDIVSSHSHFENSILAKYRTEFSTFSNILGYDPNTQSTLDALADIQHYGGPTRLLDWTSSLNIALFFATFNNYKNAYAAVFCLRNLVLNASTFDIREMLKGQPMSPGVAESLPPSADKSKLLHTYSSTRKNDRVKNQQGFFIYPGSVEVSFEDALSYSLDDIPIKYYSLNRSSISETIVRSGLIKILIPKAIMPEIRRYLTNSGLSMRILFPDYYGAIQSLYEIPVNPFQ